MSRRSSSTNRIDSGISRKIGSDLSKVIIVADNIDAVLAAASVDLEALLDALTEATDFAGITVVPGTDAHWDPVTKVLTVPTVKGDKGDAGEDLRIVSITPHTGGSFIWEFSDGTTYTTPSLRGNKGDKGDDGDKGDSVELTSIDYQGEGVFIWSFSDGTVYQTPSLKGVKGDQGDKGDKGDQGDPITMDASIYQGDGSFLWKFSDGSTYRTPDLRGVRGFRGFKGDKGDQGISVHHLKGTLTTQLEGDFGAEGETDTYTFYGDPHETIVLGWFKIRNGYNTKGYAETSIENSALAEKWASEAVGVPVKDGKYSAYHHAVKASISATVAEDAAASIGMSEDIAVAAASTATAAADTAVTASDEAEAALKDFRERYYGSYTAAPTENPYGGPIELGDLYYDEVYHELRVWAEVGGTAVWKYAGAGPKGDNFSVHKVGLRSERSLYDNEAQGFCFFATDETMPINTPIKSVSLPYSSTDEYLLEGFVGGPQSLVVTVNSIIQSPSSYTVTDAGDGDYILGIVIEADDTLTARELGRAFSNGAAYFKLSEVSADWSDPVPFSQGPKGDKGETGGVEEAPADGVQYARKDNTWVEVAIPANDVTSVAGKTGAVTLGKEDVGLSNVDNTSDINKPVSSPTQTALDNKVDKVTGKGLSDTNFTQAEKTKLSSLESSKFVGLFVSESALPVVGSEGDYANVDGGVGSDVYRVIWDSSDNKWVKLQGVSTELTDAQIKQQYESNPDTNAFTDDEKSKLSGIASEATKNRPDIENADKVHTHTMGQVTGLDTALGNKVDKESGKGLIEPAPADGKQYARKDDAWVEVVSGGTGDVEEAPIDGKQYARKDAGWVEVVSGGASTPVAVVANPSGYQMESGSTYVITSLTGQGSALLPANPSNGDIITILDGDGGFGGSDGDTFNLISDHPIIGSTTESESHTFTFNVKWVGIKLLFVNPTLGWINHV